MRAFSSIASLLAATAVQATITTSDLITISGAVDVNSQSAWWNPLDEFGDYEFLAYLRNPPSGSTANNNVMLARRTRADGAINRDCLKTSSGDCAVSVDDNGHNAPSVAVDGDGYVHVFTSMHNEGWKYFRSDSPWSATLVDHSSDMPDQSLLVTYPVSKRDANGNIWLIVRGQASGDSTARGGYIYKYTKSSKTWSRVSIWAYRKGYSVYPDDIQFSSDGDVHLQWEWSKYPASAVRHQGSYVRYTPSSGTYRSASGAIVSLPITQDTADIVFQPLTSGEIYSGDINASPVPAFQSAKMALYEDGAGQVRIHAAYRFANESNQLWQVRRASATFGTSNPWTREIVYAGENTSAAVGVTHDGNTIRIYYCRTSGSVWVLEKTGTTAWTNQALAPAAGKEVQRLQAKMRSDGTDILYLGAPKNVDANTGSLYFMSVGGR
ncbi:Fc.00g092250.m01.CDS01 [Cosmosporella sp. VM-42]